MGTYYEFNISRVRMSVCMSLRVFTMCVCVSGTKNDMQYDVRTTRHFVYYFMNSRKVCRNYNNFFIEIIDV